MNIYNDKNLFVDNEFKTRYYEVINTAISSNRKRYKRAHKNYVYYERHHILPKSIFPEYIKEKWNLVLLTPEEHIKCHRLLVNMTEGDCKYKMIHAAWCMVSRKTGDRDLYSVSDEEYGEIKRMWSETMSNQNTGRICSEETKRKISAANKGRAPSKLTIENSLKARENFKHSEHTKLLIGEASKKRKSNIGKSWWIKDGVERICVECPGEGWIRGKLGHSEETRKKIGESGKGRVRSEESKQLQSEKMKGKKTNQQEIMGRRYAGLSDTEFNEYISTMKSLLAKNRAINLRNKWALIISGETV